MCIKKKAKERKGKNTKKKKINTEGLGPSEVALWATSKKQKQKQKKANKEGSGPRKNKKTKNKKNKKNKK